MAIIAPKLGRFLTCLSVTLVLCGCAVGPDFLRPLTKAQQTDQSFINDVYRPNSKQNSMSLWWERINDPLLNGYVAQLMHENLQLVQAAERITQAQARQRIAGSSFFPAVGASGGGNRSFTGNAGGSFGGGSFFGADRIYSTNYDAGLNSSWEIDLFGKLRRTAEAADAQAIASVYDQHALVHSLVAQLLNLRVEIATNKGLLALAEKNAQNRQDMLEIAERRYQMGSQNTKPQDVLRAKNNVKVAQSDIHQYKRLIADAAYRLDVLLGQVPGTIDPFAADFPMLAPPIDVPICLPADLLDRRPDLRAAELRVQAANADIGVAIADLYPSLSLGGSIGFNSDSTGSLFSAEQLAGSLLASITGRIFEGGSLRANIDLQKSEAREMAAGYADDVLNAMREVETNLKAEYELGYELENAQGSVDALETAENIVEGRYMRGIETLRDYLEAQQELYLAQQNLLRIQQAKWNARTALYLALGGDWFGKIPAVNCGYARQQQDNNLSEMQDG